MAGIPVTESIGKTRWTQGLDDARELEIRTPLTLPDGVRPRALCVEVKDGDVLCVSYQDTRVLQWRLYAPVSSDVEWRVERDGELVIDLEKKAAAPWDCLLNLPMRSDDALLTPLDELDRMFAAQLPSLPPVGSPEEARALQNGTSSNSDGGERGSDDVDAKTSAEATDKKDNDNNNGSSSTAAAATADLDQLLEEAAAEVTGTTTTTKTTDDAAATTTTPPLRTAQDIANAFIKAELDNYRVEEREIRKKMDEIAAHGAAGQNGNNDNDNDDKETTTTTDAHDADKKDGKATTGAMQQAILDEMLRLHHVMRELRTQPSSLARFLQYTRLDLRKARANVGHLDDAEKEDFASVEERAMSATELMTRGLQAFEARDLSRCLHLLRVAAIQHRHEQSIVLLYTLCSQLGSPVGTPLLLERALDDTAPSGMINYKVGELYDQGARHFLPLFPAALYFYERAARLGSVNAMLALAQLWERGATSSSMMTDEQAEAQKDMRKYHAWLDKAIDRGCGAAYFVKGCMYLNGEHGLPKSYAQAKAYLDAVSGAKPDIMQQTPLVPTMLEELRKAEEKQQQQQQQQQQQAPQATTAATTTTATATATTTTAPAAASAAAVPQQATTPAPAPAPAPATTTSASVARLNALSRAAALREAASSNGGTGAAGVARTRKMAGASSSSSRWWWRGGDGGRVFWERTCVTGLVLYGAYTLLFPVRVLLLPTFYNFVSNLIDAVPWLASRIDNGGNGAGMFL